MRLRTRDLDAAAGTSDQSPRRGSGIAQVRFLLAILDHAGGDVSLCDSDVPEPLQETPAGGEVQYIHQMPVGGWSSISVQRAPDNVSCRKAEDVLRWSA